MQNRWSRWKDTVISHQIWGSVFSQAKVCRMNFYQRTSNQFCKSVKRHLVQVSSFTWCKLHESHEIETRGTIEPLYLLICSYWIRTNWFQWIANTYSLYEHLSFSVVSISSISITGERLGLYSGSHMIQNHVHLTYHFSLNKTRTKQSISDADAS